MVVPGLNEVVQGSTGATSSRPRVSVYSSFCCFPDEPGKIRRLSIHSSQQDADGARGGYRWAPMMLGPGRLGHELCESIPVSDASL